jgi:hypothetical protein
MKACGYACGNFQLYSLRDRYVQEHVQEYVREHAQEYVQQYVCAIVRDCGCERLNFALYSDVHSFEYCVRAYPRDFFSCVCAFACFVCASE